MIAHRIFFKNERYQRLFLILVLVLFLVPFIDKAFHIDDPLFIWSAEQILNRPGDYYGFYVNWFNYYAPMFHCMMNPPLTSYFLAGVIGLGGTNEVMLHLAFLVIAIVCALGIFEVAKEFGTDPLLSTLAAVLSPFFLISASSVMSDVLMLTFWVWSIALWMRGLRESRDVLFFFSAVLISMCILTKYLGGLVIAPILIYDLWARKRIDPRILYLSIPLLAVISYEIYNIQLYGISHLNLAASFSTQQKAFHVPNELTSITVTLAFLGGGAIGCVFLIPSLIRKRRLIYSLLIATATGFFLFMFLKDTQKHFPADLFRQFQVILMISAGLTVCLLSMSKALEKKDAKAVMLLAWIAGPFLFAGVANWTVNGRTLLPTVPAVTLLFFNFLKEPGIKHKQLSTCTALLLTAAISAFLLIADYKSANAARHCANYIAEHYKGYPGDVTFQGHWGFQYYMQHRGYIHVDINRFDIKKDDIMIVPSNQNLLPISLSLPDLFTVREVIETDTFRCAGVNTPPAGFYASTYGPAPFLFGPKFSEIYVVYQANKSFHIDCKDLQEWQKKILKIRY